MHMTYFYQIYQPEEEEEVKVFKKSDDNRMKEYEKAARRLENARLVCGLSLKLLLFLTNYH